MASTMIQGRSVFCCESGVVSAGHKACTGWRLVRDQLGRSNPSDVQACNCPCHGKAAA